MQRLLDFLSRRSGLCRSGERDKSLIEGIRRAMRQAEISDVDRFLAQIQLDQSAFDDLMAQVTVGETYFYREPDQFEALRTAVLPEIQQRKGPDHVIRFWSAGCSTGEEPWSLAMICQQLGIMQRSRILATDISRESLRKAERGIYRQWSLRGPSRDFAGTLIHESSLGWKIDDCLRQSVVLKYLNLALDNYPSLATGTWGCDVIFCRNVLIYFDRKTIEAVVRRLYDSLSPGGWLILASTDPRATEIAPFELVEAGRCLLYRRPLNPIAPVSVKPNAVAAFDRVVEQVVEEPKTGPCESPSIKSSDDTIREAQEALSVGDFNRVRELIHPGHEDAVACATLVRSLAQLDTADAEVECARCVKLHATSETLHHLHALLLMDLNRLNEAEAAVRKTLFLDRELAIAHFTLGLILQRSGQRDGAVRSFRNARKLCERVPPESLVPLSDGEHAARLSQMATQHLTMLGDTQS